MRVGFGYDVHKLVEGRRLVLGGVKLDFEKGLLGHSDADVLVHAIIDALLGAAGLGDIGGHFPPSDDAYKDASSLALLKSVSSKIRAAGYSTVVNVDSTVVCEAPRLSDHIPEMEENIAKALGILAGCVSVKATTTEGLGSTGRGQGMVAYAVALIEKDGEKVEL